jgi:type II secretion system protein H
MTSFPSVIARSGATKQSSWIASLGFASLAMTSRENKARSRHNRAFTLVELIVVMVLLLIVASMVAPRMSSFFRGRALSQEAQRLLSLTHYAQSRAVAEGVPVLLWIDTAKSTYGLDVQTGHEGSDNRETSYAAEPTITLEVPTVTDAPVSEDEDEKFGLPEGMPAIRFTPDGFFDEVSVRKIILRQGDDGALEIVPKANRLGYEIRPVTNAN